MRRAAPVLLATGTFVFALGLVRVHPEMYWADPYGRVAFRDRILLGDWLPLLQAIVWLVGHLTASVAALRVVLAAVGGLTVVAAYAVGTRLCGYAAGMVFAALLASNALFVALAIVPYQEVVFLGATLAALALHQRRDDSARARWMAAAAFNVACLTRYEAWFLVAILVLAELVVETRHRGSRAGMTAALIMAAQYGAAAASWIVLSLSIRGTFPAPEHHLSPPIGERIADYLHQIRWQIGCWPILALAAIGLAAALARRGSRRPHVELVCFVAADVLFVFLTDPYSIGNLRQTFIPVVALLFYAASGLPLLVSFIVDRARIAARMARADAVKVATIIAVAGFLTAWCARGASRFVADAAAEYHAPFLVGRWFEALPPQTRQRARIVTLSDDGVYRMAIAVYGRLPPDWVTSAGDGLPAGSTYVVRAQRPGSRPSAAGAALGRLMEGGTIAADATAVGDATIWTLRVPE